MPQINNFNCRNTPMGLKPQELDAITPAAREVFTPGMSGFLFGLRADDCRRGGGIGLPIETI